MSVSSGEFVVNEISPPARQAREYTKTSNAERNHNKILNGIDHQRLLQLRVVAASDTIIYLVMIKLRQLVMDHQKLMILRHH